MDIQPAAMKKAQFYKKILYFVNLPLVIGLPLFSYFGMPDIHTKDINMKLAVLHLADFFFTFNSVIIYSVLSKLVTGM
jgi:hypothetical protein